IRSPNEGKDAARLQKPCSCANPPRQQPGRTHVCEAASRLGRDILAPCIVERWIHQDAINRVTGKSDSLKGIRFLHIESERSHPVVQAVEPRILHRKRAQRRIDLDESHRQSRNACSQRKAGGANARSKVDCALAPARACSRRQEDRVVADTVTAQRLAYPKHAAQEAGFGSLVLSFHLDEARDRAPRLSEDAGPSVHDSPQPARGVAGYRANLPGRSYSGRAPAIESRRRPAAPPPPKPGLHHLYG